MAVLWNKTVDEVTYEVRSAGRTRRLYTNGVFHSQHHPARPFAGGVWDGLMLPAFFAETGSIKRVLVLGAGGGAVLHLLQRHIQPDVIKAIELNPIHVQLAKEFFDITPDLAELIQADAVSWLEQYQGEKFDLIIEDLFAEQDGEPQRAVAANRQWMQLLHEQLSPQGILVMNFTEPADLKNSAALSYRKINRLFSAVYQLSIPGYDNVMGVFMRQPASAAKLRKNLYAVAGEKTAPIFSLRCLK